MSNETVLVALITGLAGLTGALAGAGGAVFGPWWLARSQRQEEKEADFLEKRRAAIVELFDAETHLTIGLEANRDVADRTARANAAITNLVSLLRKGEGRIDVWLRWLRLEAGKPDTDPEIRLAYQSWAERMILAWHRGDIELSAIKKFTLEVRGGQMFLVSEEDFNSALL